jgi:Trypsin-like peptidase domain
MKFPTIKIPTFKSFTWRRIVAAAILYFSASAVLDHTQDIAQYFRNHKHKHDHITLAQAASHSIIFLNKYDTPKGLCSSTAVGPHTLLTAAHCNSGKDDDHYTTINLDYAVRQYHILAELTDNQDHVLYYLDGPSFVFYIPDFSPASPKAGDEVVIYGDGLGAYPPRPLYGRINGFLSDRDVSDVDQGAGIVYYDMSIQHGDSGSAVYDINDHHRIVGLMTYGLGFNDERGSSVVAVSFALAFPPDAELKLETMAIVNLKRALDEKMHPKKNKTEEFEF